MRFRLTYTMPNEKERPVFTGEDDGLFEAQNVAFAKRQGAELIRNHMTVMGLKSQTSAEWKGNLSKSQKNVFCYEGEKPLNIVFTLYTAE